MADPEIDVIELGKYFEPEQINLNSKTMIFIFLYIQIENNKNTRRK